MSENEPSVDDLLGDEDLGLDPPPAGQAPAAPRRTGSRWVILAIGVVLLVVLGFISSAHHDNYYLVNDDGTVHVERGWYFPFGSSDWAPSRAYKPFRLPDSIALDNSGAMTAEEVDSTLLDLFQRIARRELRNLKGGNAEQAEDMLLRANKLMHTSIKEERELMKMLGDVHFHQGLRTLKDVHDSFELAWQQFDLAAQRGGEQYGEARKWADMIKKFQGEFRVLLKESELDPDQFFGKGPSLLEEALTLPDAPASAP